MILTRTGGCVTVGCPAKLNLFLEVHGPRPDGYHEIETVMQAVTLYDELVLRPAADGEISVRCSDPDLPSGPDNLAWRAAELMQCEVGLPSGVSIELRKQIPHAAGLGGGSSDAAGTLAGLNELFGLGLSAARLRELAARLGSDVPFFVEGGTALCTGRGEKVEPVRAPSACHYVICCPACRLPTAEVYGNLSRLNLTSRKQSATVIMESLAEGDLSAVRVALFNRLGETACVMAPAVARAKELLAKAASCVAVVSGSGSAVYALFNTAGRAAEVVERARAQEIGLVFAVHTEIPDLGSG